MATDLHSLAKRDYEIALQYLQKRAKRLTLAKMHAPSIDPPHEVALKIVHDTYKRLGEFRSIDLRRFRDLISARK